VEVCTFFYNACVENLTQKVAQVVQTDTIQAAIDTVNNLKPQIIFVKTYSEARLVAQSLGAVAWWSRASEEEKNMALEHLENGGTLVATYGLSVGLNLTVRGKCIERIALLGCPWGLSALVQAASRIREGGIAYVIAWDLKEQAISGKPGEKEVAALLVPGFIDEIFDVFGTADTVPKSVTSLNPTPNYQDCRADALIVQGMQLDGSLEECILCGGSDHREADCLHVRGLCYTCGLSGHPSKCCPLATKVPACPTGFCPRCKLPTFKVAGVDVHSKSIGMDCTNTALSQKVKMILLCGSARGVTFGPDGPSSYFERLKWATEGRPPNIVAVIARASQAKKHVLAAPSQLSPDLLERIRVNREAALQRRMTSSPGPLVPTTPIPASQPETPPTRLVQRVPSDSMPSASKRQNTQKHARSESDRRAAETHKRVATMFPSGNVPGPPPAGQNPAKRQQNIQKLADAITRGLPASDFPRDRCFKCAGKHRSDSCIEPPSSCIGSLLIQAQCCTKCAIPL
jgi:hypothetical protein